MTRTRKATEASETLRGDLTLALSLVTLLDVALDGDNVGRADNIASDLEEVLDHASNVAPDDLAERLREVSFFVEKIREFTFSADESRPHVSPSSPVAEALDLVFMRIYNLCREVCGTSLNSCSDFSF